MRLVRRTYRDAHAALEGAILSRIRLEFGEDWTADLAFRPPQTTGRIEFWSGRVTLVQARRGHGEFRRLLEEMRARKRAGLDPLRNPDTPVETIAPPPLRLLPWPTTRPFLVVPRYLLPDDAPPPATQPAEAAPQRTIATAT